MMTAVRPAAVKVVAVVTAVCPAVLIQASGAAAGTGVPAEARAAALGGAWGTAREVPGTGALNQTGYARVRSVSCASAGNCSAGGFYWAGNFHPFVVRQVNGTWHPAIKVPGTGTLNKTGDAAVDSVSCASAGNCSADGSYQDGSDHNQAFVVSQT